MLEDQVRGVQKRPVEMRDRAQIARHAPVDAAVERVADNRMADRAQVHADLMRAPGMNRHLRHRQHPAEMFGAHDARDRGARAPRAVGLRRRHLLPVVRIASDRRVDPAAGHHLAPDQREIFLLDLALGELARQLFVRLVVLGDDHQPRRALVQPVHDAGPLLAADAAEIVHVVEQRVDERAAGMSRRRMHHHPRRLVDDDEIVILIEDGERQRFGLRRRVDWLWDVDGDVLSRLDRLVRFRRAVRDEHAALFDQPLDLRARQREDRDEKSIEPETVAIVWDGDGLNHAALRARFGSGAIARER